MRQLSADELAEQGQAMREMREEAGIGELQMALALDVDPKTIRNWETGKTNPGKIGIMAYESTTRKRMRYLARRSRACDHAHGSQDPLPFDDEVVIELRDRVTQTTYEVPQVLLANAS